MASCACALSAEELAASARNTPKLALALLARWVLTVSDLAVVDSALAVVVGLTRFVLGLLRHASLALLLVFLQVKDNARREPTTELASSLLVLQLLSPEPVEGQSLLYGAMRLCFLPLTLQLPSMAPCPLFFGICLDTLF